MKVTVTGKQIDVGDALRGHVSATLAGTVEKYFGRAIEAHVVFAREAHLIRADVSVHVARGLVVQCQGEATEAYGAFDGAALRMTKQLRRYKRRLRAHHGKLGARGETAGENVAPDLPESVPAKSYVLAAELGEDEGGAGADDADAAADATPMVIAEMETEVPLLTVSEAVMRMDLADAPALMFRNRAHGDLNVVYRRRDGNIGWIDPGFARTRNPGPS